MPNLLHCESGTGSRTEETFHTSASITPDFCGKTIYPRSSGLLFWGPPCIWTGRMGGEFEGCTHVMWPASRLLRAMARAAANAQGEKTDKALAVLA